MDTEPQPDLWLTRYTLTNATTPQRITELEQRRDDLRKAAQSLFGPPLVKEVRREKNILWRLETEPDPHLLIQSTVPPTDEAATLPHVHVLLVTGIPTLLKPGAALQYRIALDTRQFVSGPAPQGSRGRRTTVSTTQYQNRERWMATARKHGLDPAPDTLQQHRIIIDRKRTNNPAAFDIDLFNGVGTVTDSEALLQAIRSGIRGRKTWGCGLLTVTGAADA